MTNHLSSIADLEVIGKDTVRKEAEQAIEEAISIFDQVDLRLFDFNSIFIDYRLLGVVLLVCHFTKVASLTAYFDVRNISWMARKIRNIALRLVLIRVVCQKENVNET